jgi:hypothetical protein
MAYMQSFALLSPVSLVLVTPLILYCFRLLHRGYVSNKQDIPGPFLARFSRLWYLRQVRKRNFQQTNLELHKLYGSAFPS